MRREIIAGEEARYTPADIRLLAAEEEARYTPADIRLLAAEEEVISLDWKHISGVVEDWWTKQQENQLDTLETLKTSLRELLEAQLGEDERYCHLVGIDPKITAVCIKNIFSTPDPRLALIVHETLSTMFHIKDMQYPYEEHKEISVKREGLDFKEWGRGGGEITPHCDDLYEDVDTTMLSLTVCKDETRTVTQLIQLKDILNDPELTDDDINQLWGMEATFISGKNVSGRKQITRRVLEMNPNCGCGLSMSLDFRKDPKAGGDRMIVHERDKPLIEKLRKIVGRCNRIESVPQTGTFLAVNNHKALHLRPVLELTEEQKERVRGDHPNKPRVLYRSKGPYSLIVSRKLDDRELLHENKAAVLFKALAEQEENMKSEKVSRLSLPAFPTCIADYDHSVRPRRRAGTNVSTSDGGSASDESWDHSHSPTRMGDRPRGSGDESWVCRLATESDIENDFVATKGFSPRPARGSRFVGALIRDREHSDGAGVDKPADMSPG